MIDTRQSSVSFAAVSCLLLGESVLGQTEDASPDAETPAIDEIVVTGTRIARADYESASPLVTVDSSLFDQSGSPSVQTMLNTLPQFTGWMTENANNRSGPNPTGQAILDLRGLGFGRTLVLLDGQRIVPSNAYGSVDVNLIPPAIVERVEIISGGASAVYGSDAVAGVVNFKTLRFKGLEVEASWEQTDRNDGSGWTVGITGGLEFSRGYAFGHLSLADRDPVTQGDREYSEVSRGYDIDQGKFIPFGSPAIRQGRWFPFPFNAPSQAVIDAYFTARDPTYTPGAVEPTDSMGFNPDGSPFATEPVYNFTGDMNEPLQPVETSFYTYNFAPDNYLRLPMERTNFFGKAGIDLSPDTELFVQTLWANYRSNVQFAPTPLFGVYVGANNPHVDPGLAAMIASRPDPSQPLFLFRRMTEVGLRQRTADYDILQVVIGLNGDFDSINDWRFDAYGSWGGVNESRTIRNGVSQIAFEELSLAPDAGASICGGSGMNPFGIGSISPDCADYVRRDGSERTEVRQIVAEASVSGPLFELPAGSAQAAFGVFYKEDQFENLGDESLEGQRIDPVFGFTTPDVAGVGGGESIRGTTRSKEVFGELNVPLLADLPLAQLLEVTLGLRYGDHSNAGAVDAWKAETIWQIKDPLMFRSSYQEAVRAPDFIALFQPQTPQIYEWGFNGEPCDSTFTPFDDILGAQQDPDVAALCVAQGIPEDELPNFVDTDNTGFGISGGNPDLTEERAKTFTAGIVIRPTWGIFNGLQASVDYYDIDTRDIVAYIGFPLYDCFDRAVNPSLDPNNIFCQQFSRNPTTYQVENIQETAINLAQMSVSGYDFQADIAFEAGPGQLRLHGWASYAESATQFAGTGSAVQEFAGKATPINVTAQSAFFSLVPKWKGTAEASYFIGSYDFIARWRYVGSAQDERVDDFGLPARQYFDLTLGFTGVNGWLEGLSLRGGINNLMDKEPVVYPSWVEANTEPSTYDALGRRYFVRLNYLFQ